MTGILNLLLGAGGVIKDTYFNLVSLLLPGNGTNGAQNNTFLDSSTNNFTITRNGNTTQGTFSPFSQTGWGNYFNGSSRFNLSSNVALTPGSSDFTIECWIYPTAAFSTFNGIFVGDATGAMNFGKISGGIGLRISGTSDIISATAPNINQWTHIAITRSGTDVRLFYNGVQQGSTVTNSTNFVQSATAIGDNGGGTAYWNGYISNLRFVKGTALYTSNFTPSTAPLTAISNTQLLTLQSNRFIDNSTNAFTLTPSGSPSVVAFSPFAPTAAYTTAAVGGSGYFDGNLDYLSVADNAAFDFGSGAFTVEAWFYRTGGGDRISQTVYNQSALAAASNSALFFGAGNNGLSLYLSTGGSSWTNSIETGVAPALNAWSHVVWQRNGNTLEIYLNGALQTVVSGTAAFSGTIFNSSRDVEIGIQASTNGPLFGNLCNLRVVKGATVYTGNFTPPTGQLATSGSASAAAYPSTTNVNTSFASSACSLLLNFTNAGITDATAKNDLETVGNAQISTSVSKFPGGSIAFDGTGDYLTAADNAAFDVGSGDWTIELWANFNSVSGEKGLVSHFTAGTPNAGYTLRLSTSNSPSGLRLVCSGSSDVVLQAAWTPVVSTWYHIAAVRNGGTLYIYVDGQQIGSTSIAITIGNPSALFAVGTAQTVASSDFNGYIDDLRFTKFARYTTGTGANAGKMVFNGTNTLALPTAPFPVQ